MFKFISTFFAKRRVTNDLEITLVKTFYRLLAADDKNELLEKRIDALTALASCAGAIRDTYPGAIVEETSMAMAILEANADKRYADTDAMLDAILQLVRACPQNANDQIGVVTFLIAPKLAQNARNLGLV